MNARINWPCTLVILIGLTAAAAAQDILNDKMPIHDPGSASITGRVMLPSGISSAAHLKIILSNLQAPLTTLYSDKNGEFHFDNLPSGIYTVQILSDDSQYEPLTQQVRLKPGEPANLVLSLKGRLGMPVKEARANVVSVAEDERAVPAPARQAFDQADKLIDKGDVDSAIVQLNKAVAIYPDYARARNRLGVQYLKRRRLPEAAEQFRAILDKHPKYFDARLNFGIVLYEQRRFGEAAEELSRAVSLDSSHPAAHLFWGIVALETNDLIVAERELVRALLLGGEQYSNAHYYFAHVYLKTGRREEAAREFGLFLKTAPPGEMAAQARALLQQLGGKN
ncbi:MAG TPA: tetratricopeptide repeat protein [Blastocatellia bacterium]|nr:tetratricopeptide repeat protein [Blastocatellia bacterium]